MIGTNVKRRRRDAARRALLDKDSPKRSSTPSPEAVTRRRRGMFGNNRRRHAHNWSDTLAIVGAGLTDIGGGTTGALHRVQDRIADRRTYELEAAEHARQLQLHDMQMRTARDAGLEGRELLSFMTNPEAYGDSLATNYEAANVTDGSDRIFGDGSVYSNPRDPTFRAIEGAFDTHILNEATGEHVPSGIGNKPRSPGVLVHTGDLTNGERPIVGDPAAGFQRIWDPALGSYRDIPIPGSPAAQTDQSGAENKRLASQVLSQMANEYLALDRMGASVNKDASARQNIAARFRASDRGRFIEAALGTDAESARQRIEALRPQIVQAIMSQPEISARAFDSDRELQFFLNSVTNVGNDLYANLVALQALDRKFGTGDLISSLPEEVQAAINRDAQVSLVNAEYDLFEAKSEGVLGPTADSLEGLRLPNGEPVDEEDIRFTMQKYGVSRDEVIQLFRQP